MTPLRWLPLLCLLAACSPPEAQVTDVSAQFGSAANDRATAVAVSAAHPYVYVGGTRTGAGGDTSDNIVFLRRYSRGGALVWERRSATLPGFVSETEVGGVGTDAAGNVYLAYHNFAFSPSGGSLSGNYFYLSKLDKNGTLLWRKSLVRGSHERAVPEALAVDRAGNAYVAVTTGYAEDDAVFEAGSFVRKYAPGGALLWDHGEEVDSAPPSLEDELPVFQDLAVQPDGALWATTRFEGGINLRKWPADSSGFLFEFSAPPAEYVAANGGAVFALGSRSETADMQLERLRYDGSFVWLRTVPTAGVAAPRAVAADADGAAYLAGYTGPASRSQLDLFVRKFTPRGSVAWTYNPSLSRSTEIAEDVAARTRDEIYVVGSTNGRVNGRNFGGHDGFVLRLNGRGEKVWSR